MKTFKQFILEAKQVGTLYHYTSPERASQILTDNHLGKKRDAVSLTRNKNFHKQSREGVQTHVSFELDGDKISERHKTEPYNFYHQSHIDRSKPENDEQEEYINNSVPKVKQYIKKIRIHKPISDEHMNELKKHGIPIEHVS